MEQERLDDGLLRTVAPNGLSVLSESLPGVRSRLFTFRMKDAKVHLW